MSYIPQRLQETEHQVMYLSFACKNKANLLLKISTINNFHVNLISYLSQIEISIKHEIILYLVCEALKKTPTGAELTGNHNRVGEQKTVVICREIQK